MALTRPAAMRRRWEREKRDLVRDLTGLLFGLYARASHDPTGRAKSVTDQMGVGRREVERLGGVVAGEYDRDNDRSASRYATKAREDFERLLADVEAGRLDVIWFWDLSRSQRRLDVYVKLRDLCRDNGVLWLLGGRIYDLNDPMDVQALGYDAVNNEVFSEKLSKNVSRGHASSAAAGRPHGGNVYGYLRTYDPRTKELVSIARDDKPRTAKGTVYSPAAVVWEIFQWYAAGVSPHKIANDLQDRGIPTPRGARRWWPQTLIGILANPVYAARQIHRGEVLDGVETMWPPITDDSKFEEIYHVVQRRLSERSREDNPARKKSRDARARHLLGRIVKCGHCAADVSARPNGDGSLCYACSGKYCAGIAYDAMNDFVQGKIIAWLTAPETLEHLNRQDDNGEATKARAEAERLRGEVEKWRKLSEKGEADPVTSARSIRGLLAQAEEQDKRAEEATVPPVLRGVIGEDAAKKWIGLDLEVKRQVIRSMAEIKLYRTSEKYRVQWRWLLGPGKQQWRGFHVPRSERTPLEELEELARQCHPDAERRVRKAFAAELAEGKIPSLRRITAETYMGLPWAKRARARLVLDQRGGTAQR